MGLPVSMTICTASARNCGLNFRRRSVMNRSSQSRVTVQDHWYTSALGKAFLELRAGWLRVVDAGFGSTVVESESGFIVRVARTAAARGHAVESAVLLALAPMLPVPIAVPVLRCAPEPQLPS
jgi:hypothetical protein